MSLKSIPADVHDGMRPFLQTSQCFIVCLRFWQSHVNLSLPKMAHRPKFLDGYGGEACERITILNKRSAKQWAGSGLAIVVGGALVFAMLTQIKKNKQPV